MEDYEVDNFEYDDNESGHSDVPELRKAYDKVSKKIKTVEQERDELAAFKRETVVKGVLEDNGFNPGIASFIPATVESNPEAVKAWLGENGSLFAGTAQAATSETPSGDPAPQAQGQQFYNESQAQAAEKLANITPAGTNPGTGVVDDISARIAAAKTVEEFNEVLASVELS